MLRHFTYKFIAIFLLIPFLAASTGLSIYFHKCSCEQRLITTLFKEHKCHEELVTSCCSNQIENEIHYTDADSKCGCKTEFISIKVNDIFNITNPTVLSEKFDFTTIYRFLNQDINIPNQDYIANNLYIPDDSPPIKPAGRVLLNLLQQSKTPEFIS